MTNKYEKSLTVIVRQKNERILELAQENQMLKAKLFGEPTVRKRECKLCQEEFLPNHPRTLYCSDACREKGKEVHKEEVQHVGFTAPKGLKKAIREFAQRSGVTTSEWCRKKLDEAVKARKRAS